MMLVALVVLLVMAFFSTLMAFFLARNDFTDDDTVIETFVLYCLTYNNIIPISMFVTMDLIRLL
jgi:ABC-type sulfate transport system permease component